LDIKGINLTWIQKSLFFVALGDALSYRVSFGNAAAERPVYDLVNSISQSNWRKLQAEKIEIAGIKQNQSFRPGLSGSVKARREKLILTVIIIMFVVGTGFWLYSLLARTGKKPDGPDHDRS
jgi:hypothetical protein